jgi:hypothetical protein
MSFFAAAAFAAPVIGGLIGNLAGAGDRNRANAQIKQAIADLQAAGMPPDMSLPLILQKFEEVGISTPQLIDDINVAASEVAAMTEEPTTRNMQLEALDIFKQMSKGRMGLEERAALNQLRQQEQQDLRSNLESLDIEQRRRGAPQGQTFASKLLSTQASADRGSLASDRVLGMLSQRIKEGAAGLQSGASQMRSQDYQTQLAKAQAADERQRFIANNAMARETRNTEALNEALRRKDQQAFQVATANTQLGNVEKQRQADAQRQFYLDKLERGKALANARTGVASQYQQNAGRTEQMYSGMGTGLGGLFSLFK